MKRLLTALVVLLVASHARAASLAEKSPLIPSNVSQSSPTPSDAPLLSDNAGSKDQHNHAVLSPTTEAAGTDAAPPHAATEALVKPVREEPLSESEGAPAKQGAEQDSKSAPTTAAGALPAEAEKEGATKEQQPIVTKTDISILLASKDDSENDLAGGPGGSGNASSSSDESPLGPKKGDDDDHEHRKKASDSSFQVEGSQGGSSKQAHHDRFHYSVSLDSVTDNKEPMTTTTTTTTAASAANKGADEISLIAKQDVAKKDAIEASTEAPLEAKKLSEAASTSETLVTPTTPAAITTTTPTITEAVTQTSETSVPTTKAAAATAASTKAAAPVAATEKDREEAASSLAAVPTQPTATSVNKELDGVSPKADRKQESSNGRPGSPQSPSIVLSPAIGSGIAATAAVATASAKPQKPVPGTSSPSPPLPSTSRRPALGFAHFWNEHRSTSTSTPTSVTRRGPMPSIRRRFRPFGSPFASGFEPFGADALPDSSSDSFGSSFGFGASPFRPLGYDSSPFRPSVFDSPPSSFESRLSPVTKRPSRGQSSPAATTDAPSIGGASSGSRHPSSSSDAEAPEAPSPPCKRKHLQESASRPFGSDDDQFAPASPDKHEQIVPPAAVGHNTPQNRHRRPYYGSDERRHRPNHGSYNNDRFPYEVPSSQRPAFSSPPGFGSFFEGSSSPFGFDLLNPLTSWLDDLLPSNVNKRFGGRDESIFSPSRFNNNNSNRRHQSREDGQPDGHRHRNQDHHNRHSYHGQGSLSKDEHDHGHGHGYYRHDEYDPHCHYHDHDHHYEHDRPPRRPYRPDGGRT